MLLASTNQIKLIVRKRIKSNQTFNFDSNASLLSLVPILTGFGWSFEKYGDRILLILFCNKKTNESLLQICLLTKQMKFRFVLFLLPWIAQVFARDGNLGDTWVTYHDLQESKSDKPDMQINLFNHAFDTRTLRFLYESPG